MFIIERREPLILTLTQYRWVGVWRGDNPAKAVCHLQELVDSEGEGEGKCEYRMRYEIDKPCEDEPLAINCPF